MIIFPGQFESFRTRGNGDRILSISTYSKYAREVSMVTNDEIGTEYLIVMIPTSSKEAEEFRDETLEESTERFRKRMNSLINTYSELTEIDGKLCRETIKTELKGRGLIRESTKELDLQGYVQVIAILNEKIYERKKNTGTA